MAVDPPGADQSASDDPRGDAGRGWASRGVVGIGSASFFSDVGHEMVTSLLPTFLRSTLHAGPAALGAIEGVSDALIGLAKMAGGPLSNDPHRRARLASGGYLATGLASAAIGLTVAVWQVAILRAIAWVSRGIRSPARDTLLTSITPRSAYGRAFGLERAGDNAGAILGPLVAAGLVGVLGVRATIWLAVIPGIFAALSISLAIREARRVVGDVRGRRRLQLNLRQLGEAGLVRALSPAALFELGNLATTLLILRATGLLSSGPSARSVTAATSLAILLYAGHNAAATIASLVGGQAADRLSARVVFAAGGIAYIAGYAVFAIDEHLWPVLLAGFVLAGTGIGLAETAQSTVVAQLLPDHLRANGFGML
ncbi:MAG TPA: MFS transporter, partial [Segeticoccus sp.]|uniref:MFS transporter n=1 Tax=Segeticoccus sp. TaxID=2706531 RepID=UPI002D7E95CD